MAVILLLRDRVKRPASGRYEHAELWAEADGVNPAHRFWIKLVIKKTEDDDFALIQHLHEHSDLDHIETLYWDIVND